MSVSPWHADAVFATVCSRSEEKGTDAGESACCSASTVRELVLADQNFRHVRNSSDCPMVIWELVHSATNDSQQIWADSKMSHAAQ